MHIEAKNLVKKFKERTAVNRVSLRVEKGEIVGLLGPNGAGKTTTFYMIVGLEHPTSGEVYLSDIDITSSPMYKRAELGISYLTQEASIFRSARERNFPVVKDDGLRLPAAWHLSRSLFCSMSRLPVSIRWP